MTFNIYHSVYLTASIFGTYTIYRFMKVFFSRLITNKRIELLSYMAYYILVSFLYLNVNIPVIMLICNVLSFLALSYNYKATLKERLTAISLIYIVLMAIETIIALLTGFFNISILTPGLEYTSIIGMILVRVVSFILVLFIGNYRNIKKGLLIPTSYWLSIFIIPSVSFYIILILLINSKKHFQVSIAISLLLIINIIVFYLYDGLMIASEAKVEKFILSQEKKYYAKQFELMKSSINITRALRHDLSNHMGAIESLLKKGYDEKVLEYIQQLRNLSYSDKEFAHSGNIVIDSILNYKLQEAESKGANISLNLKVPSDLELVSIDMVVILGNLLDNAIEAINKLENDKKILASINYKKGILLIHIENAFDGNVSLDDGNIISSKKDKKDHGLGLKNVLRILEKYNGSLEYSYTESSFTVDIIMYI